ncbi:MAG: hypothetical protein ACXWX2_08685 [Actinomycetota bacterium]
MIGRITRAATIGLLAVALITTASAPASAHERRPLGDLEMTVGFGTEPAYAGQPNSVQVVLVHDGEPVVDLGDTLDVEVAFGDQAMSLELEPFFAVGAFGEPGDYRAWFIPTRAGEYSFHVAGTVDGEEIDETFTSGPGTFSDVSNPADISFPVQDPTTGELAERIDREVPRLTSGIDEAGTAAARAVADSERALADARQAADDVAGARTLGLVGIGVGALGLLAAAAALATTRRRTA